MSEPGKWEAIDKDVPLLMLDLLGLPYLAMSVFEEKNGKQVVGCLENSANVKCN